jgi:hypothetical protein
MEVAADRLGQAVERMNGGAATLAQSNPRERVFDLTGNPTAIRTYAWSPPEREAIVAAYSRDPKAL